MLPGESFRPRHILNKTHLDDLDHRVRVGPIGRSSWQTVARIAVLLLLLVVVAWAADGRTVLKPGWNMFSPQQDVEVGQQVSADAERQVPLLNESRVDNYVNALGRRLSTKAPGEKYPYHFKVVNDRAINALRSVRIKR
jgi:predicted Zn-dependent protease